MEEVAQQVKREVIRQVETTHWLSRQVCTGTLMTDVMLTCPDAVQGVTESGHHASAGLSS